MVNKASDVVVVGLARTPLGSFGGALRDVAVWDLGAAAIRRARERSGVNAEALEQVIFANCRQAGDGTNSARTASARGGVPLTAPAVTADPRR